MNSKEDESAFRWSLKDGAVPYILPLAVFLLLGFLEQQLTDQFSYELGYAIRILLTILAMAFCWKIIPRWSTRGFGLAILFGLLSCPVWIALDWLQRQAGEMAQLNFLVGERQGFAPELSSLSLFDTGFLSLRLLGLVIVIPLIEEIFWRGFLARYLIDEKFETVPVGRLTRFSFVITTLAFAAVHPEILAAIAWGAGINFVYMRTQNLWSCIVAHAITNASLGIYILTTGNWHLW